MQILKTYMSLGLLLFMTTAGIAQVTTFGRGHMPVATGISTKIPQDMYVTNRAVQLTNEDQAEGSPYLTSEFKNGFVRTSSGEVFTNVPVRIDLVSNEIQFMQNGTILVLTNVDSLSYFENNEAKTNLHILKTGYPKVDRQTDSSVYEFLEGGDHVEAVKYLRCTQGTIKKMGEVEKLNFTTEAQYYFFIEGNMIRFKLGKKNVQEALSKYKEQVDAILKESKLDLKTELGVKDLVRELDARLGSKAF